MTTSGEQVTTLTFFRYHSFKAKLWAFWMMQLAHAPLSRTKGLEFYKLLGSGKQNFNPMPDWSVYGLLQVWKKEAHAHSFFESSQLMQRYRKMSREHWTLYMRNSHVKGKWSGGCPFVPSDRLQAGNPYVAVITRATIKPGLLLKFWKNVPASQEPLQDNQGLIYTKGVGEVPFLQMATFSIWRDQQSLMDFAYKSKGHRKAIQQTRQLQWYKEEMFSRFQPYRSVGSWDGSNPLPHLSGYAK